MLHKIWKQLSKLSWLISPWMAGPLLGLAAFCPLFLFSLAGSWLPHLLAFCLLWTGLLLLKRKNYAAGWLVAWSLLASTALAPYLEKSEEPLASGRAELKLAQVNVLQFNDRHELVAQQTALLNADIVAFQEVNQSWAASLVKALADEYPYYSLAPQDNCYGMALFSKRPLKEIQLRMWEGYPAISAKVENEGQDIFILSLHAASPVTRQRYHARNKQLAAVTQLIKEAAMPTLVIGDFNTVPWDPALRRLLIATKLRDSRARNYTATWPNLFGKWGIPIDYVLYSPHWQRVNHHAAPIIGSDHRAMVATLAMKAASNVEQNSIRLSKSYLYLPYPNPLSWY